MPVPLNSCDNANCFVVYCELMLHCVSVKVYLMILSSLVKIWCMFRTHALNFMCIKYCDLNNPSVPSVLFQCHKQTGKMLNT